MRDDKRFQNRYRHTQQEVFSSEFCLNQGKIKGEVIKLKNDELDELTLRRLMSYIYGAPILDVSRSHTTTQHSR